MPMLETETTFDPAIAMARQSLYQFAAIALLDPKAGAWERLHALRDDEVLQQAAAFLRSLPQAVPDELARGERPLADLRPSDVLQRLPDCRGELNAQYENTFGLLVSNACPFYETEYINSKFSFQRSNSLADISGFYRAFGLTTSKSHPERPDHVVLELEFMAFLLGSQLRAAEEAKDGRALEVCRGAQTRFLTEHLAWWTPAFARLLGRENPDGFYAAVGIFLASLVAAERATMRIPLEEGEVQPSYVEPPEECASCMLSTSPHS